MVITEYIIRKALDESINNFMLEEGGGWDGLVKSRPGIMAKNIGKSLWNGVKMYMDYRTNGQWNRKYNQHVKGNGFTVGSYYLNKWFNKHYDKLQNIIYGDYYGINGFYYAIINNQKFPFTYNWKNRTYELKTKDAYNKDIIYELKIERNNITGTTLYKKDTNYNEIDKSSNPTTSKQEPNKYEFIFSDNETLTLYYSENNETPEEYVSKYCNVNSFLKDMQYVLGNGNFRKAAINYINGIQETNNEYISQKNNYRKNYANLINMFTLQSFYEWYGKAKQQTNNQQPEQAKQQSEKNQQLKNAESSVGGKEDYFAGTTDYPKNENKRKKKVMKT